MWQRCTVHHFPINKLSLQTSTKRNSLNLSYISFLFFVNFENLTIEFYVSYILHTHIKFRSNHILFIINLFLIYNFRLQKLEILSFVWWHYNWSLIFLKFCKHENIIRICNLTIRFSKFTFNTKIYEEFVRFLFKLVMRETLFK